MEITYGVCSVVEGNKHVTIWDFDAIPKDEVQFVFNKLQEIQVEYGLPTIYVFKSSETEGSVHLTALSLTKRDFRTVFTIAARTPRVDPDFLLLSARNGYFTLRIGPKRCQAIKLVKVLESNFPDEASIDNLNLWVIYVVREYYVPTDTHPSPPLRELMKREFKALIAGDV